MAAYIISFEISDHTKIESFKTVLQSFGFYCPLNKTAWVIISDKTAKDIRDQLGNYIDSNDKLFVIRSGTEAAWKNSYGAQYDDWLKKYL